MRTIRLTLAYDGTNYSGWQVQPDRASVQQVVEQALLDLTGEPVKVAASGRTDAGVHALAQVVSFNTDLSVPIEGYRWGLVTKLPADIVVTDAEEMPYGFHARFDAVRKSYRYVIHASRTAVPWLRNYVWWHRSDLDVSAMQQAVDVLIGEHDFRCFETQWPNRSSSIRTVYSANWSTCDTWSPWSQLNSQPSTVDHPSFLCFEIAANGFLYNMVRAIVGTLIHVGRGRWSADDMRRILETGDRSHAGDTAPAQGLYLASVETIVDPSRIAERMSKLEALRAEHLDDD
ncbi:MAG: tRNA pseudouridine(38-40) synthase TruA [Planctomycetales bacterium 12-60-4]|nr:MAG: tRNA pseudouridine(38-40) synthase TruA [Planctomycetales bacterium 12-60-4]